MSTIDPNDLLGGPPQQQPVKNTSSLIPDPQDLLGQVEPLAGMMPGIDYRVGTGAQLLGTRFQIGRQSNQNETEAYLDKKFGAGNWAKAGSRYVITPEKAKELGIDVKPGLGGVGEQPVVINPWGPDLGDVSEFSGSIAGPFIGGVAAGATTGGLGFVPGVAVSALGSAGGKVGDELIKYFEGTSRRDLGEIAKDVATEGLTGGAGEGAFRLATPFLSKLLGPFTTRARSILGPRAPLESTIDPNRLALTQSALEEGYRPHISTATGSRFLGRFQSAAEFIFGSGARDDINRAALMRARNELATDAGSVARTNDELIRGEGGFGSIWEVTRNGKRIRTFTPQKGDTDVVNGGPYIPKNPAEQIALQGKAVGEGVEEAVGRATHELAEADMLTRVTQRDLEKKMFNAFAKPDAKTGAMVKESLDQSKKAFYSQARSAYAVYDDMVGGASIDVSSVKDAANNYLNSGLVRTVEGGDQVPIQAGSEESLNFLRQLAGMDSSQTAQALISARTALSSSIDRSGLPGVPDHIRRQLIKSIDTSLDNATEITPEAGKYLKDLRSWYRDGINKYKAYEVRRLSLDPSSATYIGDDQVVDFVSDLGSSEQVARLKSLLPSKVWGKVQRGVFDNMMQDVSSPNKVVDSGSLYKAIQDKGGVLEAIYGADKARNIRVYSKYLAGKNGDIDLSSLPRGDPYTILRDAVAKQQKMDTLLSQNPNIVDLFTKNKYSPTEVIPAILRSRNINHVEQLKRVLGPDSDAWQQFQSGAMEKILQPLVTTSDDAVTQVFKPEALDKSLEKYSPQFLNSVFGPEITQDIYNFAKTSRFATSKQKLMAGSIIAGSIALHPWSHLGAIAKFKAIASVMSKPGFIRYMTEGITNPNVRAVSRETARIVSQASVRANETIPASAEP